MWYVYMHYTRSQDKPFYIGIGSLENRSYSVRNRNKHWQKIVTANKGFSVAVLYSNLTKIRACKLEKELIEFYGRVCEGTGCLTNLSSGGQGNSNPDATTRFKIGKANRGKKFSTAHKAKLSKAKVGYVPWNKGKTGIYSPETIAKIKAGRAKQIFSPETRAKLSSASKGRKASAETKKKMSLAMMGNTNGKRL